MDVYYYRQIINFQSILLDIQREAIKAQRQKKEEEELDKALGKLEKGIISNKKLAGKKSGLHGVKGIKTAADVEQAKENKKKQPRPKVEGIVTMDEMQEKLEKKKKDNKAPQPQIEGIKTAGLK